MQYTKSVNVMIHTAPDATEATAAVATIIFYAICQVFVSFPCYAYASRSTAFFYQRIFLFNHSSEITNRKKQKKKNEYIQIGNVEIK